VGGGGVGKGASSSSC